MQHAHAHADIPAAPRGVPLIRVEFYVDANGSLLVTACVLNERKPGGESVARKEFFRQCRPIVLDEDELTALGGRGALMVCVHPEPRPQ